MLLFSEKGKAVLHGIASSGMGCGTSNSFPGVSANVFKFNSIDAPGRVAKGQHVVVGSPCDQVYLRRTNFSP